ncbi:helix-turn-helix domain-containing protein [Phytohabitans flavus]|uniref:helix-turn-helix domain-containing protein n=1 Tax=Phytohabitans flavus TaxID=1076124 RepID=UPI00363EE090
MSEGRTARDPGGTPSPSTAPASLGALLAALRLGRGWSQLRVAEQLTAAAGLHTVSRHEISRWERGERVPGDFWLGWLAVVLDVPSAELALAAEAARRGPARRAAPAPAPVEGQADLLRLAHAWLADPAGSLGRVTSAAAPTGGSGAPERAAAAREPAGARAEVGSGGSASARDRAGAAPSHMDTLTGWLAGARAGGGRRAGGASGRRGGGADPDALAATVAVLRRQDDLVGGTDLAGPAGRELGAALGRPEGAGEPSAARAAGRGGAAHRLAGRRRGRPGRRARRLPHRPRRGRRCRRPAARGPRARLGQPLARRPRRPARGVAARP